MEPKVRAILVLALSLILTGCARTNDKSKVQNTAPKPDRELRLFAEQIKIDGLENALIKLQNGQTEFGFIGITSNGIDCIYFMPADGKFNLDFEAMEEDQLPYIEKLKAFADTNNFESSMTTYGNKPQYKADKPAQVIHIETNSTREVMAKMGERIQREIFKNNKDTVYDIVP